MCFQWLARIIVSFSNMLLVGEFLKCLITDFWLLLARCELLFFNYLNL